MSTYKSTTDHAAEIRAALKAKGWSSRKISVRADYYSMGSSIDITIKDVSIPLNVVKAIAEDHERIDRCQFSGEILAGCNRYVHVRYDYDVLKAAAQPYIPAVEAALAKVHDNYLILVEGTPNGYVPFMVGKRNGYPTLWQCGKGTDSGHYVTEFNTAEGVAEAIVARLADLQVEDGEAKAS